MTGSLYLLYPFCSLFWILKIYFVTFFQFAITQIEPLSSKGGFWKDLHTGCSRADVFNSTAVERAEWGDWLHSPPRPPSPSVSQALETRPSNSHCCLSTQGLTLLRLSGMNKLKFFCNFLSDTGSLGISLATSFPLTLNFPSSVLPAFACLLHEKGLCGCFRLGWGSARDWAAPVLNFLPEVIHIATVETLQRCFFLQGHLWASASVSSCPGLLCALSFCECLRHAHVHAQTLQSWSPPWKYKISKDFSSLSSVQVLHHLPA